MLQEQSQLDFTPAFNLERSTFDALDETDRELLRLLLGAARGRANAIPLSSVALALKLPWITAGERERSAREIKARVKELIEYHGIKIGARRNGGHGYFLIVDAEDHRIALRPLEGEFYSLLRRIRALSSPQYVAELYGQLRARLEQETRKVKC